MKTLSLATLSWRANFIATECAVSNVYNIENWYLKQGETVNGQQYIVKPY